DRRLGRVLRSVEARPPKYITDALGPRPDQWRDLRLWRQGAVAIESYRQSWGVRSLSGAALPLERALGPEPPSGIQQAQRVRAGPGESNAARSLRGPPPRARRTTSTPRAHRPLSARATSAGAVGPLMAARASTTSKP